MPDRKDKPRSKVLQSWTEIKDLSKHIQAGGPGNGFEAGKRPCCCSQRAQDHRKNGSSRGYAEGWHQKSPGIRGSSV
jgi:hypothetical protein